MADTDLTTLHNFVGKMLGDLGGAFAVPTVRIGFRTGLFDALHEGGPASAEQLAVRAGGLTERYVREWAMAQACNGYINYDPAKDTFSLSPEQSMVFAVKESPVYLAGAFDLVAAMIEAEPKVEHAFRTGGGVGWGESAACLFCAVGAFFRPGYANSITQQWILHSTAWRISSKSARKLPMSDAGSGFPRCSWPKPIRTAVSLALIFTHHQLHKPGCMPINMN